MARIVRIGKRDWLLGMTWSSFEDAPSKDELKQDAERLGGSWTCVRIGESAIQAGFCAPVENIKKPTRLYSLAAMLADSREQPWLGIFKISEGLWWYIAVRDGHAILPDGDVIGDEQTILEARDRHSGYTDWKYIEGGIDVLTEFIGEVEKKPTPVRSLVATSSVIPLAIAGIGLVAAAAAGGYFWLHQQAVKEQERQAAMARMREQLTHNQPPASAAPSPLVGKPTPNDWLAACASVLWPQPLSQYGWALEKVSCAEAAATVHWTRADGATVKNTPDGVISTDGNSIDQSIPLTDLNASTTNDAVALADAKTALKIWAQTVNAAWSMTDAPAAPPTLPGSAAAQGATPARMPPAQPSASIGLDILASPFKIDFSSIPGLRLTRLSMTDSGGWHLEGTLYGK
ncbi:MAG TPA: type 4b pilus protein PilO2 [Noviherbaspirillum sp.]|nr:type 4b pilus protein PilO2 [Noviherbaspirillum sp.]